MLVRILIEDTGEIIERENVHIRLDYSKGNGYVDIYLSKRATRPIVEDACIEKVCLASGEIEFRVLLKE